MVDVNSPIISELIRLIAFGPGGASVAHEPGNSRPPAEGSAVGGVDVAVDWFVDGLRDDSTLRILFLIGAPGNGKSYCRERQLQEAVFGTPLPTTPSDNFGDTSMSMRLGM